MANTNPTDPYVPCKHPKARVDEDSRIGWCPECGLVFRG